MNDKDREKQKDITSFINQQYFFKWTPEQEKRAFKRLQEIWKTRGII